MKTAMKKISLLILLLSIIAPSSLLSAQVSQAAMTHGLSPTGQGAFEDLARCARSQDSTDLNIFFLVDSSASLRIAANNKDPGSDPQDKRALVLSQTIRQLSSLNNKITVNFALDTFDATSPGTGNKGHAYSNLGWKHATETEVNDASAWVEKNVPNYDGGQHTNWLAGLQNAQHQLANAPHGTGNACQAIIWFTDGALDMGGGASQNASAIDQMCGIAPTSTSSGMQKGLIPNLRANNITLIGVLLSSDKSGSAKTGLVSYFQPVVEGSGIVDSTSFGGHSNQNFECGLNPVPANYSRGAMLVANNPNDLALLFAAIPFMVGKGQEIKLTKDNEFTVDKGVASAAVVIPSKTWKLDGPGVAITSESKDSNFNIDTVGDVSTVEFNIPTSGQGNYKVVHEGTSPIAVFLDSGVRIQLDSNVHLTAGKGPQQISGTFTDLKNKPIDIGIYDNPIMNVTSVDTSGQNRIAKTSDLQVNKDGTWSGQVLPFDSATSAQLQFSVTLRTKPSGTELPKVSQTFNIPLVVPAQFCNVVQVVKVKNSVTKFSDLTYKKSPATGNVIIKGAKAGNCSVKFSSPAVISDPIGRQSKDFQISVVNPSGGSKSVLNTWVQIPQDQEKTFNIAINNKEKAKGQTLMSLPVLIRDEAGTQSIQSAAKIEFTDVIPEKNKIFWIVGLLILGLTLPLVLLQIVNHIFARYRMENLRIASMKVRVVADSMGSRVTLLDSSPIALQDRMFEYFESNLKRPRKFTAEYKMKPVANFESHLPRNPFGSVEGLVVAAPGDVVVASESTRVLKNGSQAPVPLNLNKLFFATTEVKKAQSAGFTSPKGATASTFDDDFGLGLSAPTPVDTPSEELNAATNEDFFEAQLSIFLNYEPAESEKVFAATLEAIAASQMWQELSRLREGAKAKSQKAQSPKERSKKVPKGEKSKPKERNKPQVAEADLLDNFGSSASGNNTSGSNGTGSSSSSLLDDPDDPWA